jgi:hypothetical protein
MTDSRIATRVGREDSRIAIRVGRQKDVRMEDYVIHLSKTQ